MQRTPPPIRHLLVLEQEVVASTQPDASISGDRIGFLARKVVDPRASSGGKYSLVIKTDAFAVLLRVLRVATGAPASCPRTQPPAIRGEKIYCECSRKPRVYSPIPRGGAHRGQGGFLNREAKAIVAIPLRSARRES